jgi:RNA polymerase sigma factor (sigma-70 family)
MIRKQIATFDELLADAYCIATIKGLITRYTQKVGKYVDYSDLESIAMEGAWNALCSYNPEKSAFTTHLHNTIEYKLRTFCYKSRKKYNKMREICKHRVDLVSIKNEYYKNHSNPALEIINDLDDEEKSILIDKFIGNYTNIEMAEKYNVNNQETMRLKIKKILHKIQNQ